MSTSSAVGPSSHHRAEAALDFVTRQINKLVEVIRQYGHVQTSSDGTHVRKTPASPPDDFHDHFYHLFYYF